MRSSTLSNMDTQEIPRRRSGYGIFVVATLLALVAAALGTYAWQLWNTERKVREELKGERSTVAALRKEQRATGLKLSHLESESSERGAQLSTANASVSELEAKLAA